VVSSYARGAFPAYEGVAIARAPAAKTAVTETIALPDIQRFTRSDSHVIDLVGVLGDGLLHLFSVHGLVGRPIEDHQGEYDHH
jgi:hypothetical protein